MRRDQFHKTNPRNWRMMLALGALLSVSASIGLADEPVRSHGPPAWVVEMWESGGPPAWILRRHEIAPDLGLPGPPQEVLDAWRQGDGFALPGPPKDVLELIQAFRPVEDVPSSR